MKKLKSHMRSLVAVSFLLVLSTGCIRFNPVPREEKLGSHLVSIRPFCDHATSGSLTQAQRDGTSRIVSYEFTCGETTVVISENMLSVNGKSYGTLNEGDHVAVDHGKVRVNLEVRAEVP